MKEIDFKIWNSPFGALKLAAYDGQLVMCDWMYRKQRDAIDKRISTLLNANFIEKNNPLCNTVEEQILAYSNKNLKEFDIPILMVGTSFQQKVWELLKAIPYGQTITYLQLSELLNNKLAIRAVASANGANALSIIIPCHRVIGSKGELTGYAGGIAVKKKLLDLENPSVIPTLFEIN